MPVLPFRHRPPAHRPPSDRRTSSSFSGIDAVYLEILARTNPHVRHKVHLELEELALRTLEDRSMLEKLDSSA